MDYFTKKAEAEALASIVQRNIEPSSNMTDLERTDLCKKGQKEKEEENEEEKAKDSLR